MSKRVVRRPLTAVMLAALLALALAVAGCGSSKSSSGSSSAAASTSAPSTASGSGASTTGSTSSASYHLANPSEITVGIYAGGMPYVDDQNGKCVGIDCTDLNEIAAALGLKVKVEVMSFPAMLAGVQSHRLDVAMGELSWTAARAKQGLMTDPIYYSRAAVLQPDGSHIDTLAGLQGKTVGALVGANWIQAVHAIPGAKVATYQSSDELYSDLSIGRLQTGFIDALEDQYVKKIKPNLHYQSLPLQITSAEAKFKPAYATFLENQEVFFLNKGETKLEAAMNTQIEKMWENKSITKALTKYGTADATPYLTPTPAVLNRRGVDRPKTWVAPSLGYTPAS